MDITKEKLKEYANKLMFDMSDSEYDTLLKEFDVMLKHMDLIGEIKDLDKVNPMSFPFELDDVYMREDIVENEISTEEALSNAKEVVFNEVKVPKVVE
ncbi:MAG TPA: Asp-tRNA(Asn)/Glu-tRNA(Gln) amidotransferase subunit GatC [Bacilli bacterium]|nr:Asp-tRNA(Asn)/Glu-tRNA(Gln) amidotransferase subunit GatC [Bacilli bacterium]